MKKTPDIRFIPNPKAFNLNDPDPDPKLCIPGLVQLCTTILGVGCLHRIRIQMKKFTRIGTDHDLNFG